ncbi:MAG: tetratricopeptide repeat protein [Kangiellaceae bacterium]|nr:tetratricopeptide repeat protein [Kangiellaceae bacterium]MCW9000475.1 tetratricopeptide repeat protein [Kangiellaceae bacterium]
MKKLTPDQAKELVGEIKRLKQLNELSKARKLGLESLSLVKNDELVDFYFQILNILAQIERRQNQIEESINHYLDIVELAKEYQSHLWQAHAFRHIADIKTEHDSLEQAEMYYEKTIAIYQRFGETESLSYANSLRGYALLKTKQRNEMVKDLWQQAENIYRSLDIKEGVEECRQQLEHIELIMGKTND